MSPGGRGSDVVVECDALLVGASAGSMLAALVLDDAGLRPIIVEKTSMIGGGTAYSGGVVWAPANSRMLSKGIDDSVEDGLRYLSQIGGPSWDRSVAETYISLLPRVLAYVEESTALRWVTYKNLPDYFAELPGGRAAGRILLPLAGDRSPELSAELAAMPGAELVRLSLHSPGMEHEWQSGRVLIGALWARIQQRGIPCELETRAVELGRDNGQSFEVQAETPRGRMTFHARLGVLLNTGGFEWNADLMQRHAVPPRPHAQTPPGNEGDGYVMAVALGAGEALMDRTIEIPSVAVQDPDNDGETLYRLFFQDLAKPHSIVVNRRGRRFANETFFPTLAESWHTASTDGVPDNLPCYFVFDSQFVTAYGMPAGVESALGFVSAPTWDALALQLGLPEEELAATVANFNRAVAGGSDEFRRGATPYQRAFGDPDSEGNPTAGNLSQSPYFAVELHPATSGHRGGVVVDPVGRVLDRAGDVIQGLYACGNVAAGTVTGDSYISGASIGHALVFGYTAAQDMVRTAEPA